MQLNQTTWRELVNDCDLFSPAPNCLNGGVGDNQYGNDCQRPRQSNSYWLTSLTEGKYAIERYDYDTGIVPNAGSDWRTVQGEGVCISASCSLRVELQFQTVGLFNCLL